MSTAKILALVGQEEHPSYKTLLHDEVSDFIQGLAKRSYIDPPLPPNTDLTDAEEEEIQGQLHDVFDLPFKTRQIIWLAFSASYLTPLVSQLLKLSQTIQPKGFNTLFQTLSFVPDNGPERYFRQFLHSPQARGLPNAFARAILRGIDYKGPDGIEGIGRLMLNLVTWCDQKQSDDKRSPFDAELRIKLSDWFNERRKTNPVFIEYCSGWRVNSMAKAILFLDQLRDPGFKTSSGLPLAIEERLSGDALDCRPGECTRMVIIPCTNCKCVRYCSAACQEIGWKRGHQYRCFEPNYEASMSDNLFLQ